MKSRKYAIIFAKDSSKRNEQGFLISSGEQYRALRRSIQNHKEIKYLSTYNHQNGYSGGVCFGCIDENIFAVSFGGGPFLSVAEIHGTSISHISKSKKQLEQISRESEFPSCKLMANFNKREGEF